MARFIASFRYAILGIIHALKSERNMKIHAFATVLVVLAGFYFNITRAEWLIIILLVGLVIAMEMINTAIEALVDLVTHEYRSLAAIAKNVAAGAVLIAAFVAVIGGLIIFIPYIF